MDDILFEAKRIFSANLTFPIILGPDGSIMDGQHRLMKAIILGKKTIWAVQFHEKPPSDWVEHKQRC